MSKIRVGVIGAGNMGKNHVRVYNSLSNICDLVGVFDPDYERCKLIANQYSTQIFDNYLDLINEVEAVSIVTPTKYHYDIAVEAINRNKSVLLEKPMTETVEQGTNLVKIADQNNIILQIGHIERFNPAIQILPSILANKQIIAMDFQRMSPYDPRINDVDIVQDLMIHDIDIMKYLLPNEIKKISAVGCMPKTKGYADYAVASILLESDIIVHFTASRVTEQKIRKLSISTSDSYIELDYIERKIVISRSTNASFGSDAKPSYRQENIIEKVFVPNHEPLTAEIESFILCILNTKQPTVTGNDGLDALKIVKKIHSIIY